MVWGETIGKVAREQAAVRPGGIKVEHVGAHEAISDRGTEFTVRAHIARVCSKPHRRGHHAGRCTPRCRKGLVSHRHLE